MRAGLTCRPNTPICRGLHEVVKTTIMKQNRNRISNNWKLSVDKNDHDAIPINLAGTQFKGPIHIDSAFSVHVRKTDNDLIVKYLRPALFSINDGTLPSKRLITR